LKPFHTTHRPMGMVERLQVPMLRKACEAKTEWTKSVPLALYAIRLIPHHDIGLSSYEYIHGQCMQSALDLLHHGWLSADMSLNISSWTEELAERLELLREHALKRMLENVY